MKPAMNLNDCNCGGIPQVTYEINGTINYGVVCAACGNQTPDRGALKDAVDLWNQIYCLASPPHSQMGSGLMPLA